MAILDLQRHNREDGRIRFGHKVGDKMQTLDKPRLTSADRELLEKVAKVHGGEVREWAEREGEYELFVESESLPFLIEVGPEPFSQWWERWSGNGCLRRCDGVTDTIHEKPCDCDKDGGERACKPTSRIPLMLPETGDALWRAESKSLHVALDLPEQLGAAIANTKTGEVIAGVLSIGRKQGKRGRVPVPQFVLSTNGGEKAREPSAPAAAPEPDAPKVIDETQRRKLFAKGKGLTPERIKEIVLDLTGQDSTKAITLAQFDTVLATVENFAKEEASAPVSQGQGVLEKLKQRHEDPA